MQDSAEDESFQLQQTIKTEKEERKEKACLGCNLLVQGKESHIKLALLPPLPPFTLSFLASYRIPHSFEVV